MLFPIKSKAEILQEMMDEIAKSTDIKEMPPGSFVRTLLEVINEKLGACYRDIDLYTAMSFVSTSKGMYLDMIGRMLGCTRLADETDDNYRYRITNQVFTAAAANRTAVRLKCLAVPGVKDIYIAPYSRGNGSFTVYVITDEIDTPNEILTQVQTVVNETKAEGIRAIVTKPTPVPIDIRFNIVTKTNSTSSEFTISNQLKEEIGNYVDTIPMGGTISIAEILRIAQSNRNVTYAYLSSLHINNEAVIAESQYQLEWDERAYVNSVVVVI